MSVYSAGFPERQRRMDQIWCRLDTAGGRPAISERMRAGSETSRTGK